MKGSRLPLKVTLACGDRDYHKKVALASGDIDYYKRQLYHQKLPKKAALA